MLSDTDLINCQFKLKEIELKSLSKTEMIKKIENNVILERETMKSRTSLESTMN